MSKIVFLLTDDRSDFLILYYSEELASVFLDHSTPVFASEHYPSLYQEIMETMQVIADEGDKGDLAYMLKSLNVAEFTHAETDLPEATESHNEFMDLLSESDKRSLGMSDILAKEVSIYSATVKDLEEAGLLAE